MKTPADALPFFTYREERLVNAARTSQFRLRVRAAQIWIDDCSEKESVQYEGLQQAFAHRPLVLQRCWTGRHIGGHVIGLSVPEVDSSYAANELTL